MKRYFIIAAAVIAVMSVFPLSAAPKKRLQKVMLSSCVEYEGYLYRKFTIKKVVNDLELDFYDYTPDGEGKLTTFEAVYGLKDVITGTFAGNNVTDACLSFCNPGVIYKGDLKYELTSSSIKYTLYSGEISGYYKAGRWDDYKEMPFKIHILDSLVLTRDLSSFVMRERLGQIILTKDASKHREFSSTAFQEILQIEKCDSVTHTFPVEIYTSGKDMVEIVDGSLTCDKFNLINGASISTADGITKLEGSVNAYTRDYASLNLKKVMNGGSISAPYKKRDDYLYDSVRDLTYKRPAEKSELDHFLIEYNDGRIYYGSMAVDNYWLTLSEYIISMDDVPDTGFFKGIMVYPDGKKEVYYNGYTLEEMVAYNETRLLEDLQDKIEEELRRHAEEVEKQQELNELYEKYGYEYVDTYMSSDGRRIKVGTPVEFLEKVASIRLDYDNGSQQGYDWCYRRGYFWVEEGRVISVSYYYD